MHDCGHMRRSTKRSGGVDASKWCTGTTGSPLAAWPDCATVRASGGAWNCWAGLSPQLARSTLAPPPDPPPPPNCWRRSASADPSAWWPACVEAHSFTSTTPLLSTRRACTSPSPAGCRDNDNVWVPFPTSTSGAIATASCSCTGRAASGTGWAVATEATASLRRATGAGWLATEAVAAGAEVLSCDTAATALRLSAVFVTP